MPISVLDIIVLGVTVISAILAAVRGFSREVLGIAAWVIAAAAAWFLFPSLLPFTHQYISHETIALVVTVAAIFIVVLLVMSLITVQISDLVLDSRIGAMDRTLGFIFGTLRGILICILGWLLFTTYLSGKTPPEWAINAKSRPMLESSSESIRTYVNGLFDWFRKNKPENNNTTAPPPEAGQPAAPAAPANTPTTR